MVRISARAMPARVEVRTFAAVDADTGAPSASQEPQVCRTLVSPGTVCAAGRDGAGIAVQLPTTLAPYVVLYVEWYVPESDRPAGQPTADSRAASYGFHLG